MKNQGTLFLHYPCFDGIVSAALAAHVLMHAQGWRIRTIEPVDYSVAKSWLARKLPEKSAVVDFLYHPDAEFWADHHETSFLNRDDRSAYTVGQADGFTRLYDPTAVSCAGLIFSKYTYVLAADVFRDMAAWADKIDGARYATVEEAVLGSGAATDINLSLAFGDRRYCKFLVRSLENSTLEELSRSSEVLRRAERAKEEISRGLQRVARSLRVVGGDIAVMDVAQSKGIVINRYSPYLYARDARYSVSLVRSHAGAKITAMRNPWLDFESVDLGTLFRRFGGGGHQRVASVLVSPGRGAAALLEEVVSAISLADSGQNNQERPTHDRKVQFL